MIRIRLVMLSLGAALAVGAFGCRSATRLPSDSAAERGSGEGTAMPVVSSAPSAPRSRLTKAEGAELLGSPAAEWNLEHWMNSEPLTLERLRGRVVLVRWWTAPDCPYCAGTAPSLNELHSVYKDRGLVVVGIYHHKSDAPMRVEEVTGYTSNFGFKFPVAIDPDWRTLKAWWYDKDDRRWTSVSFLIDKKGVFRHIHPGGKYALGDPDYVELKASIETLLAEPASVGDGRAAQAPPQGR